MPFGLHDGSLPVLLHYAWGPKYYRNIGMHSVAYSTIPAFQEEDEKLSLGLDLVTYLLPHHTEAFIYS